MAVPKRKRVTKRPHPEAEGDLPITAAQRRADARHLKDTEDRTRYLLVSLTVPGLSLYYRVQDDAWSFDDPMQATLFKRRPAAKAIQKITTAINAALTIQKTAVDIIATLALDLLNIEALLIKAALSIVKGVLENYAITDAKLHVLVVPPRRQLPYKFESELAMPQEGHGMVAG